MIHRFREKELLVNGKEERRRTSLGRIVPWWFPRQGSSALCSLRTRPRDWLRIDISYIIANHVIQGDREFVLGLLGLLGVDEVQGILSVVVGTQGKLPVIIRVLHFGVWLDVVVVIAIVVWEEGDVGLVGGREVRYGVAWSEIFGHRRVCLRHRGRIVSWGHAVGHWHGPQPDVQRGHQVLRGGSGNFRFGAFFPVDLLFLIHCKEL